MAKSPTARALYVKIVSILKPEPLTRRRLIDKYIASLSLSREELLDKSTSGRVNVERSLAGQAIDAMERKGMIIRTEQGVYTAADQRPVIIRKERCEQQILKRLAHGPAKKSEITSALAAHFGTERTLTESDDGKLSEMISSILKRLSSEGVLLSKSGSYSLAEKVRARLDDIQSILTIKNDFKTRLHKRGGEYFEYFFMTLLEKYMKKHDKTVITSYVTGGSDDGGIDGIIETADSLGFRETTMVQIKNRADRASETDVRGFWGAVCARQGSRGIFATTSGFHTGAIALLDTIPNCVGIDGDKIFAMALEVGYGIHRSGDALTIDEKII